MRLGSLEGSGAGVVRWALGLARSLWLRSGEGIRRRAKMLRVPRSKPGPWEPGGNGRTKRVSAGSATVVKAVVC